MADVVLSSLLTFTRDGEWGKGEPEEGFEPALVIRGTDFEDVRFGKLKGLPLRYIEASKLERKRLEPGDVLIEAAGGTKDQPTGRNVFLSERIFAEAKYPLICASFARFLRPDRRKINPEFLFWKLQDEYHSRRMTPFHVQHTGVARFQYTQFANSYELSVPSLDVQFAISSLLTALDDKIELNRRMNETLERQARALFRDWFVDFGPVKAKMAGDAPYLAPELWALFPDSIDNDGVPEGWKAGALSDHFILQRGFDLPKSKRTKGPFPVIAASGPNGTHNEAKVEGPGVCTGRSGVLGGVYYVEGDFWPLNTSLWVREYRNSTPLHAMFTLHEIDIATFNAGSAVPTLNRNHIHQHPVLVPPMSLIAAFDRLASQLYAKKFANEKESRTLAETRDLLLPKLMSGEIRIGEAVKALAAA